MTLRFAAALPLLSAVLLAPNCSEEPVQDDPTIIVPQDVFHVTVGDSVRITDEQMERVAQFAFDEVVEDSRCPTSVQCVRAGEAVIRVTLQARDGSAEELELRIPGMRVHGVAPEEAPQVAAGDFRFRLLRLDPYPGDEMPSPTRTTATLQVEFAER